MVELSKWCLLGIPDHEGVIQVGGRVGAAGGPAAFRRAFARLKGRDAVHRSRQFDRDLPSTHRQAADAIRDAHHACPLSVVIGGGNDHSYSQLMGVRDAMESMDSSRIGCINIDAHFDLRKCDDRITSGSPFYVAIETGVLVPERFVEFGIQRLANAPELWEYAEAKGIKIVPFEELRHGRAARVFENILRDLAGSCDKIVVSLDLDAAAAAFAPGVSAPMSEGFSSTDLHEMMEISGREHKVASLGIYELNPEHDQDDRTARLAASCAYLFVAEALKRT